MSDGRYDLEWGPNDQGPRIVQHFCHEWDDEGEGCYGTNPNHSAHRGDTERMSETRGFRYWLAHRGSFTIGVFFGFMVFGYVAVGWWRGVQEGWRECKDDLGVMLWWSRTLRRDAARAPTNGDEP